MKSLIRGQPCEGFYASVAFLSPRGAISPGHPTQLVPVTTLQYPPFNRQHVCFPFTFFQFKLVFQQISLSCSLRTFHLAQVTPCHTAPSLTLISDRWGKTMWWPQHFQGELKCCFPLAVCQSSYTPESISTSVQISLALPAGQNPFTFQRGLALKSTPPICAKKGRLVKNTSGILIPNQSGWPMWKYYESVLINVSIICEYTFLLFVWIHLVPPDSNGFRWILTVNYLQVMVL